MTTLYFRSGTCALAPHVVLEWIGAPYEAVPVKAGSPELLALNPAGAVPVLKEDDGWVLTQNGAILHYLVAKHPDAGLAGGAGIQAEAEANRWASFITGDLHPAFFPVFMAGRYTTDSSDEAKAEVQEAGLALVRKKLDLIEAHLAGREWFLETRSIIDAYALPMLRWARSRLPEHLDKWPSTAALLDKLEADPAVQRVLEVHRASA
jgi:glutathione S-transferase